MSHEAAVRYECFIADVNVSGRAEVRRWITRQRFQFGCFIADINELRAGQSGAMSHEAAMSVRMLHRRCQRTGIVAPM